MSATHPLSCFHHWLLASSVPPCPSRAIVLHGGCETSLDPLVVEIAEYLNEYDADGAGHWLAATSDLVRRVAESPDSRRLLGMSEPFPDEPPDLFGALTALGRHGHIVLRGDTQQENPLNLPDAFHAGIGSADCGCGQCHLILNPDLVHPCNLAPMVSDVFLDWHHETFRAGIAISTRNAPPSAIQDQTCLAHVAFS